MRGLAIHLCLIAVIELFAGTPSISLCAEELTLDAKALFERGVSHQVQLTSGHDSIELQRGTLFEDDGPAAGYSYQSNEEKLTPDVWIRKELIVPTPRAHLATLLVGRGGNLKAQINGRTAVLSSIGKQGHYWQAYRFSPSLLKPGKNTIDLSGTGSVWIARDDEFSKGSLTRRRHPNRSLKSQDAGATWNDKQLGTRNDIDGEYYVRVFLEQYRQQGKLTLGVLDIGNLNEKPIGPPLTDMGPIRIKTDIVEAHDSAVTILVRTGTSFVPDAEHWSRWQELGSTGGFIKNPKGRFLQIQAMFSTDDPLISAKLKSLSISASPTRPADWTKDLHMEQLENQRIVRSSIPFQYEPFDRVELARLRNKYQLDQVASGAKSEFEIVKRLAAWSAMRWKRMHLKDSYPSYNALKILGPHQDGTPIGGFCQQFNIVFLQACESFGIVGRLVSIGPGNMTDKIRGGHETAEIWSNEFGKWIYVDGNTAWYAVDQASRQPLSLWELRLRQLAALTDAKHPPIEVIRLAETKHQWVDLKHWPPFVELRLIPRSNFLQQPAPLPLNQGMRGWFWTGHYVWTDDKEPARMLYSNRIANRDDFEWTLNQAHLVLEASPDPGTLRVHIDTETPGFASFIISANGRTTTHSESAYTWRLKAKSNTLQVMSQNSSGRKGPASSIKLHMGRNSRN